MEPGHFSGNQSNPGFDSTLVLNGSEKGYLKQMAELGETQSIICTEHIRSVDGTKLLPKGSPINQQVIQRLINHKLLKPIDLTTQIEDAVDLSTLTALGNELMEHPSEMGKLLRLMRKPDFIARSCSRIHLELPIRNKLTIAQKFRPELLTHSLRVSLALTVIGEQLGLPEQEIEVLATAGLLHDLGELHIEVGDLPAGQSLNLNHWQQVRSHPLIGAMILKQLPAYQSHVSRAVQEHHERLDGSGYPYGIKAIRLSRAGRLLAFTELSIGALRKHSFRQLHTIIRSNLEALDPQPVGVFLKALRLLEDSTSPTPTAIRFENIATVFKQISELILSAEKVRTKGRSNHMEPCLLDLSVVKLKQAMQDAGFDLNNTDTTLQALGDDQTSFAELEDLLRETIFQIRKTLLEMHRRSMARPEGRDQEVIRQWIVDAENNLNTAGGLLA